MEFLFFDHAGKVLFVRSDAEQATYTHHELGLALLFPYDSGKVIQRGQLVGFQGVNGWNVFEIRNAKTYEPDAYQEITAESLAIAELTDEFADTADITNVTAPDALEDFLTGTLWQIGTVDSEAQARLSSGNVSIGNVWSVVRTIEQNWNVYITPRVTIGAGGITGRYLDIAAAGGTWRGLRLSLEKNADEVGVTYDDTATKTALFGFGRSDGGNPPKPLTFKDVVWSLSEGDPADKPANQTYVEDTAATAAYGRNGRPRYGYYQNGDISDPEILLQKTWEALQACNAPDIQIECRIADLYRLGYNDVPIRLHDAALVEIRGTGVTLLNEIIQYTEDLLEPINSRVTIGKYIPNIVYIARDTYNSATGGGRGSGGNTILEEKEKEYLVQINANETMMSLNAQRIGDLFAGIGIAYDGITNFVTSGGALTDPITHELILDANGMPMFPSGSTGIFTRVQQHDTDWSALVQSIGDSGEITAASIALHINENGSNADINADHINLTGGTVKLNSVLYIQGNAAVLTNAASVSTTLLSAGHVDTDDLFVRVGGAGGSYKQATWQSVTVVTGLSITMPSISLTSSKYDFVYENSAGVQHTMNLYGVTGFTRGSVSGPTTQTFYYLGTAPTTPT